ncbi:hypothetical protein QAD02_022512 [Eretmocerus hayati]|uniref:Uncharacterized protein n=1 Tax=Eretmocerus hayati TaxID=131215 RepID=A0ACC2PUB9_9HYME|nr:hypothetical protein QAD02_022512 [Eretmocerus hayati]
MDYTKFMTQITKKRRENAIRTLAVHHEKHPGLVFLAGGVPNAETFPFKEIFVTYNDGIQKKLIDSDLQQALQYGTSQGFPPLLKKWREFQTKRHSPKYKDWDIQVTTGAIEGCSKLFEMFIGEGESVMIQAPAFPGILSMVKPMPMNYYEIKMDDDGVLPSQIIKACEDQRRKGQSVPKVS